MQPPPANLQQHVKFLHKQQELVAIDAEVDPHLEIAEIHRRVAAAEGPALLFRRVKGSPFPVVTNLFGSKNRVQLAFADHPERLLEQAVELATKQPKPSLFSLWRHRHLLKRMARIGIKRKRSLPISECEKPPEFLQKLPFLHCWPEDGGRFLTLPLVYTEHPDDPKDANLGIYRIQRHEHSPTTGMHWQIAKGGGYHYHAAERQNRALPAHIFLGGPPSLMLSAIAPLPEKVSELLLGSFLQGSKLQAETNPENGYPILGECEFALLGEVPPHIRKPEGPFGDHYGYYSLQHPYPIFQCKKILHRKNAIYPATIVGKPRQEDFHLGVYLQELLSPLIRLVMPDIADLWSYGDAGFHSVAAAVVRERYKRQCMTAAFRILGEGQLALTKFLLLTDQPIDLRDFKKTLTTILARCRPETDIFVFANLSLDTLDYTGPTINEGSRGVLLGVGDPIRRLPEKIHAPLPPALETAHPFCPGCLVAKAKKGTSPEEVLRQVQENEHCRQWPLIALVDHPEEAAKNSASFLWTLFTRFNPAADLYSHTSQPARNHLSYTFPLIIDARMKKGYPAPLKADPKTAALVTKRWEEYFPEGMEMGDGNAAHVY